MAVTGAVEGNNIFSWGMFRGGEDVRKIVSTKKRRRSDEGSNFSRV
jgi:hypothetical protein